MVKKVPKMTFCGFIGTTSPSTWILDGGWSSGFSWVFPRSSMGLGCWRSGGREVRPIPTVHHSTGELYWIVTCGTQIHSTSLQWICFPDLYLVFFHSEITTCNSWSVRVRHGEVPKSELDHAQLMQAAFENESFWTKADCFWKACLASTAIIVHHPSWLDECKFEHV